MASADSTNNTMTDLEAATVSEIAQSLFPWVSPTRAQLARSLWAAGSVTLVVGMTTAFHLPPAGPVFAHNKAVYYSILVVILAAAAVEMVTAFFLPRSDGPRFHAFAKRLLPFTYLLLLVAVSAGGFAIPFKL